MDSQAQRFCQRGICDDMAVGDRECSVKRIARGFSHAGARLVCLAARFRALVPSSTGVCQLGALY